MGDVGLAEGRSIHAGASMHTSPEPDADELMLSQSCPIGSEPSRHSRLARKAESARQARLRHKHYVSELQEQVTVLQTRVRSMELQYKDQPTAAQAVSELQSALTPEQQQMLQQWLQNAQGENHVLKRYQQPIVPAPALEEQMMRNSTPMAINGSCKTSPMDSDEDTFTMSRSWDDIEGARSLANLLTSPNGFHPAASVAAPSSFILPSAASSAPTTFSSHFTSFTPGAVRS